MKSLFLVLGALILVFSSCQKELSGPGNTDNPPGGPPVDPPVTTSWYIKFKLDGVTKEYKFQDTSAITLGSILGNRIDIQGYANEKEDDYEGLAMAVYFEGTTLTPGTFTSDDDLIFVEYNPNHPTVVYSAGFRTPPTPDKVTITKIADGEVTGTFNFTVFVTTTDGNGTVLAVGEEFKTITDGEFKVPIAK